MTYDTAEAAPRILMEFFSSGHASWLIDYYKRKDWCVEALQAHIMEDIPEEHLEDGFAHALALFILAHRLEDISTQRGAVNTNFFWRRWTDSWPENWHEPYGQPYNRLLPAIRADRLAAAEILVWQDEDEFRSILRRRSA